jgi:hypothetical protein
MRFNTAEKQTSSQILSRYMYKSSRLTGEYKKLIEEYAKHGIAFESLNKSMQMKLVKSYLFSEKEIAIDIEIPKSLAIRMLSIDKFYQKTDGDLGFEIDGVIKYMIKKYSYDISEDLDEEIERYKEFGSRKEVELGSV